MKEEEMPQPTEAPQEANKQNIETKDPQKTHEPPKPTKEPQEPTREETKTEDPINPEDPHAKNYTKPKHRVRQITRYLGDLAIPSKYRHNITRELTLAGIRKDPYILYGMIMWVVLAAAFLLAAYLAGVGIATGTHAGIKILVWILLTPISAIIFLTIAKLLVRKTLDARVYTRVKEMERIFPEFLAEVSLNLKTGADLEEALTRASREDFGVLSEEMQRLATRTELGFDLQASLEEFIDSYNSDVIEESFELILISYKTGSDTPKIVDRIVENMKVMRNLRNKVVASVSNYKIFILTVTAVIAPAMMALAYHVINLVREITQEVLQVSAQGSLPITLNPVQFNENHFIWFSILALATISTFSSLISTYIEQGSIKGSAKKTLAYNLISIAVYALCLVLFAGFFELFSV